MKKTLLLALLALAGCKRNEQPSKGLVLTGNIDGLKKGTILIKRTDGDKLVTLDSAVANGDAHFTFNLDVKAPEMLLMVLDRGVSANIDDNLMFFADPGRMTIETDLDHFYAKAKITGSINNDLYEEYKKVRSRYTDQQLELSVAKFNADKPFDEKANEGKIDRLVKSRYLYAINFAVNHRDHEVAPYIALSDIADANLKYLDLIRRSLTPKVANSRYGKMLASLIEERRKQETAAVATK
jgi:hypothetical protein